MEFIRTPKVENVRMLDRYSKIPSMGTLYLTATHLIFNDPDNKKETWVLHMHIATLEKLPLTTTGSPLLIRTKTFLSVTFVIPRERDCHDVYLSLQQLSQPRRIEDLYCFTYTFDIHNIPKTEGWNFFDLLQEYKRMGVPNEHWSLSEINRNYEVCETYPKHIFVPKTASNSILLGSAKFRSKGRLPVLSYLHPNKACICRCSQPLSGFNARCVDDEQLFTHLLKTNPSSNIMYVVDTRPKINALANRAAGKGYENEAFYDNTKFHFLGVENIHVMRSSLTKLIETLEIRNPSMSSFLNGLESSGWLKHIKAVLDTSLFIARTVDEGITVIVHCSDGWDRTAQVCSLASVILDPFYRTIKGFQTLIEKDWLAFGHKFSERYGHMQSDTREISPVFTQLLDATWQLMQLYPCSFQFNEHFLIILHDHIHSCQYGTFVGNCEKERLELRLSERTYSFWGYIAKHYNEYVNPLFTLEDDTIVLHPNLIPQNIKFWRSMYCRFETGVHPREIKDDIVLAIHDHSNSLDDHIKFITKKFSSLKGFISKQKPHTRHKNGEASSSQDKRNLTKKKQDEEVVERPTQLDLQTENNLEPAPADPQEMASSNSDNEMKVSEKEMVALDWKSIRDSNECSCSLPFDNVNRRHYCRKCGYAFCMRCITSQILPGHLSQMPVPVCKPCADSLSD